jgi:hypothetical protein
MTERVSYAFNNMDKEAMEYFISKHKKGVCWNVFQSAPYGILALNKAINSPQSRNAFQDT